MTRGSCKDQQIVDLKVNRLLWILNVLPDDDICGFSTPIWVCLSSYRHLIEVIGNFFSWKYAILKSLAFYSLLWKLIVVIHCTKSPVEGLLSLWTARDWGGQENWIISGGGFFPHISGRLLFFTVLMVCISLPADIQAMSVCQLYWIPVWSC